MNEHVVSPIAVVGVAAIMPDAPDATSFWQNLRDGRYSVSDVPPDRWDPELYYDPDPAATDKTYSRIGGWVREHPWEPQQWRLPIPPKVAEQFDLGQQWAVSAARSALLDAGWPQWNVDPERVAVILGNAIGGEKHYRTALRVQFPEFAQRPAGRVVVHRPARRDADGHPRGVARAVRVPRAPHHRGHHARRALQRAGRPGCEPVRPPRPELHHRRGLCARHWPPRQRLCRDWPTATTTP